MANGWITERASRTGTNLNPNPSKQRKGPLKKIVRILRDGTGIFDRDRVLLECGHTVWSDGQYRARCSKCADGLPPDEVE